MYPFNISFHSVVVLGLLFNSNWQNFDLGLFIYVDGHSSRWLIVTLKASSLYNNAGIFDLLSLEQFQKDLAQWIYYITDSFPPFKNIIKYWFEFELVPLPKKSSRYWSWTYIIYKVHTWSSHLHWWKHDMRHLFYQKLHWQSNEKCANNALKSLQLPSQGLRLQHIREMASVHLAHLIIWNVIYLHNLQKSPTQHFVPVFF